jgi:hypothetical protein
MTQDNAAPFDTVGFLMSFDDGDLDEEQVTDGFQHLIDSGVIGSLEGHYRSMARSLIEQGRCHRAPAPPVPKPGAPVEKMGPYEMVRRQDARTFGEDTYRIVLYGAYNAMGLIGTECNGIVVMEETATTMDTIVDEIAKESTGAFGASHRQDEMFNTLMTADEATFRHLVNTANPSRLRRSI